MLNICKYVLELYVFCIWQRYILYHTFKINSYKIYTLVDFYNLIVFAGKIPVEVCEIYYGANLMGLAKDDGGVRPIAIGFALRRLGGKIQSNKVKNFSKTTFWPLQLGVGT